MSESIQIREDTWRIEDNGVRFFVLNGYSSETRRSDQSGRSSAADH